MMFFEPLCKGSCRFSNIFSFTPILTTFVPVYDPTLIGDRIFVLGGHQKVLDGLTSLKMYLYPVFWQVFLILSLSPYWYGTTICKFCICLTLANKLHDP